MILIWLVIVTAKLAVKVAKHGEKCTNLVDYSVKCRKSELFRHNGNAL